MDHDQAAYTLYENNPHFANLRAQRPHGDDVSIIKSFHTSAHQLLPADKKVLATPAPQAVPRGAAQLRVSGLIGPVVVTSIGR